MNTLVVQLLLGCFAPARCAFEFSQPAHAQQAPPVGLPFSTLEARRLADKLGEALAVIASRGQEGLAHAALEKTSVDSAPARDVDEQSGRKHLVASQELMDAASSVSESEEERTIKRELGLALAEPTSLGAPDRTIPGPREGGRQPDLSKCPLHWVLRGSICEADRAYEGPCGPRVDLRLLSVDQKLAFERYCGVQFPRFDPKGCNVDYKQSCPSLWREVGSNICQAPDEYDGQCDDMVDTGAMDDKDRSQFGLDCLASWPCVAAADGCRRDYSSPCPVGWFHVLSSDGGIACRAPPSYAGCYPLQDFNDMSPAEKNDWEYACNAFFPCTARSTSGCNGDCSDDDPTPALVHSSSTAVIG